MTPQIRYKWTQKTPKASWVYVVVVVVDDSHIQRIVLATEETTVIQQVSHRPIKYQPRLWSQRGMKVNGSHHGDNPLLRPTGIQIATTRYATLQAMVPTNVKKVNQTSLLHIESNLDRLGLLPPTYDTNYRKTTMKSNTETQQCNCMLHRRDIYLCLLGLKLTCKNRVYVYQINRRKNIRNSKVARPDELGTDGVWRYK